MSNKGDWLGKIAVVRDVVRCSDDVEGENEQPATENGTRKRQCGACRRPDPGTERTKATRACAAHPGLGARLERLYTACKIAEKNFDAHPPALSTKRLALRAGRQDISDKTEPYTKERHVPWERANCDKMADPRICA